MTAAGSRRAPGSELRVAVVGAGWMGLAHLRAYAATPGVRIVGLVSRSRTRAAELAERFDIEATFDEVGTMLDTLRPDGISVTTREHEHVEPVCRALERGVGVLVEKPMATSSADAITMAAAAEAGGAILMPAHVLRFAAPYRALKQEVEAGRLGRLVAISSRRDRDRAVAEHYAHVHPVMLSCVHDIDLVAWLSGASVRRVRGLQSQRPGQPQPDLVWAQLELDDGILANVATSMLYPAHGRVSGADRLDVYGTDGVATVDLTRPLLTVDAATGGAAPDWLLEPSDGGGAFGAEIGHFCECLRRGGTSDVVTVDEAIAGLRVAEAIVGSANDDGAVVDL